MVVLQKAPISPFSTLPSTRQLRQCLSIGMIAVAILFYRVFGHDEMIESSSGLNGLDRAPRGFSRRKASTKGYDADHTPSPIAYIDMTVFPTCTVPMPHVSPLAATTRAGCATVLPLGGPGIEANR